MESWESVVCSYVSSGVSIWNSSIVIALLKSFPMYSYESNKSSGVYGYEWKKKQTYTNLSFKVILQLCPCKSWREFSVKNKPSPQGRKLLRARNYDNQQLFYRKPRYVQTKHSSLLSVQSMEGAGCPYLSLAQLISISIGGLGRIKEEWHEASPIYAYRNALTKARLRVACQEHVVGDPFLSYMNAQAVQQWAHRLWYAHHSLVSPPAWMCVVEGWRASTGQHRLSHSGKPRQRENDSGTMLRNTSQLTTSSHCVTLIW